MMRPSMIMVALLMTTTTVGASAKESPAHSDVLRQIASILPKTPTSVTFIDPAIHVEAGRARDTIERLDAFLLGDDGRIYINVASSLWKKAATSDFHRHAFAAVLWHEMAHLEGADENEARRREQELWTAFIRDGKVDADTGLRYARLLSTRRH